MRTVLPYSIRAKSLFDVRWPAILVFILAACIKLSAQVAINTDGTAPHASAMLEVKATNKGFLPPRVTEANRPASPATGLIIYQTDGTSPGLYFYDGASWQKFGISLSDYWQPSGSDIYYTAGKVSVGVTTPDNNGFYSSNYISGKAAVLGADQFSGTTYANGQLGVLFPSGQGIPYSVYNVGVLGIKPNAGLNGAGIYGWSNDDNTENYGGILIADGTGTGTNHGVYAMAKGGSINYAGKFKGRVLIEGHNGLSGGADSLSTLLSSVITHTRSSDSYAIYGSSRPQPGYGYGVYGYGGWRGVYGYADGVGYTGYVYGVTGSAYSGTGGSAIGIYGYAAGGDVNWAGYFSGDCYISSDLRIGTTTQATGYSLSVNGKIACTEVLVQAMSSWPDYVFADNYQLMTLPELEQSIKMNKHLPGLPAAAEVEQKGIVIGDMQSKLLEKVEELTLHLIQQDKMIRELQDEIKDLKAEKSAR